MAFPRCPLEPLETRIAPAGLSIDVATLNGSNGFSIVGAGAEHYAGWTVAGIGDLNGDGIDDFALTEVVPPVENRAAETLVVFGNAAGFPASLNPASLNGTNGFRVTGLAAFPDAAVAHLGDFNNDGFDDLLSSGGGAAYVIFGKSAPFPAEVPITTLNGTNGYRIYGNLNEERVTAAGDVNGDGFSDLLFGARGSSFGYVVFGRSGAAPNGIDVGAVDGSNGFNVLLPEGSNLFDLSTAGDMNDDGYDDVAFMSVKPDNAGGFVESVAVLFGHASPSRRASAPRR